MGAIAHSRVLVTGGAGFIGRRAVRTLLDMGADVTVADKRPWPGNDVPCVVGDLCDPAVAARAVQPGTDAIVHLAAVTSVLQSLEDPDGTYRNNVGLTAGLLELARKHDVGTFVFASTNAVAGDVGRQTITERTPLLPLTPYGATKAASEMLLSCYAASYGITAPSLRFSNVYGPGMAEKDSFVPRLMRAARDNHGVQIYGDGTQLRDLVHVDDVVSGMLAAWQAGHSGPIILAAGESVCVNDILFAARAVTGAPIPAENVPAKPGEMPAVIVDIALARSLGYAPALDLKAGMATVWPEFQPAAGGAARAAAQTATQASAPASARTEAAL